MRYCRFEAIDGAQLGRIDRIDNEDVITAVLPPFPETLGVTGPPVGKYNVLPARPKRFPVEEFKPFSLKDVRLLAPVIPSKIVCVGRNYREHASELGHDVPLEPLLFLKPPSSIIGPEANVQLPPSSMSQRVDYEGELGVVIARRCSKLATGANVRPYIRGYTCVNDVTARDLQKKDSQWTRAKGFDTFCPVGPLVTDEFSILDGTGADVTTRVNGEQRQKGNTREFIFGLDVLIHYISQIMTLEPGDLLSTGTPAGVAPVKSGDVMEVSVSGVGTLRNTVV